MTVRIGVYGASGRMGREVCALLQTEYADRAVLAAEWTSQNPDLNALSAVDVVIDFSLPDGTRELVARLLDQPASRPILISGTTGLDERDIDSLRALGEESVVLHASNFSSGLAVVAAALEHIAPRLRQFGYEPVITETHHVHKQDRPSGTALTLGAVLEPEWQDIDIHSIREGDVVGRHVVEFRGTADTIEIAHDASNRSLFARGALDAALWLHGAAVDAGFFTMAAYLRRRFPAETQPSSNRQGAVTAP